jgi:large subunit ribosomal protein L13
VDTLSFKTVSANDKTVTRAWLLIDAENQVVGRLASRIAHVLRGKNKAYFTPHTDCGDFVVVINAEKIRFTGSKLTQKEYVRYTGYPGGQRFATPKELLTRKPEAILEHAVRKMLPKNKLADAILKKLFVYAGTEHPHKAQKPKSVNLLNK